MSKEDQKKQWKKEAAQLKKDLSSKRKVVKKREVEIKFGGVKPSTQSVSKKGSSIGIASSPSEKDDLLRKQLGL